MSTPDVNDPEFIKEMFYQYLTEADYFRLGGWIDHVMDHKKNLDIDERHLILAFDILIELRKDRNEVKEALILYLKSFQVEDTSYDRRLNFLNLMLQMLDEKNDIMTKIDWEEILHILKRQSNYLAIYSSDKSIVSQIQTMIEKVNIKISRASNEEESEMRELISELTTTFYKNVPDKEAADYAAQVILNKI